MTLFRPDHKQRNWETGVGQGRAWARFRRRPRGGSRGAGSGPRYLIAPAGHPIFGDEFIARGWLRHLRQVEPGREVVLDCRNPGLASVLLRGCHPHLTVVNTVWRLQEEEHAAMMAETGRGGSGPGGAEQWDEALLAELIERVADCVRNPGRRPLVAAGVDLLRAAGSVHLLGGGYINALWPHHGGVLAAAVTTVGTSDIPLYATGQGLLPAGADGDSANLLAELWRDFSVIDCRDDESVTLLRGLGVSGAVMGGDDAWLVVEPGAGEGAGKVRDEGAGDGRRFMVCVQSDLGEGAEAVRAADALLAAWGACPEQVVVVEAIPRSDSVMLELSRFGKGARFIPFTELWRDGLDLNPRDIWLSTRFHPHLLAAAHGCSGVALDVLGGYYSVKHASLCAQGSAWEVVDISAGAGDIAGSAQVRGAAAARLPGLPTRGGFPPELVRRAVKRKRALAREIYG